MSDHQSKRPANGLLDDQDALATNPPRGRARKAVSETAAKVEEAVGRTFGEPARERVRGAIDGAADSAQDTYLRARHQLDRRIATEPYKTLAMALGAGIVIGLMLARRSHTIIYQPKGG